MSHTVGALASLRAAIQALPLHAGLRSEPESRKLVVALHATEAARVPPADALQVLRQRLEAAFLAGGVIEIGRRDLRSAPFALWDAKLAASVHPRLLDLILRQAKTSDATLRNLIAAWLLRFDASRPEMASTGREIAALVQIARDRRLGIWNRAHWQFALFDPAKGPASLARALLGGPGECAAILADTGFDDPLLGASAYLETVQNQLLALAPAEFRSPNGLKAAKRLTEIVAPDRTLRFREARHRIAKGLLAPWLPAGAEPDDAVRDVVRDFVRHPSPRRPRRRRAADSNRRSSGSNRLAQDIDRDHFKGLAPYAQCVARTVFLHSLADQDTLKGVTPERLRYAVLAPTLDISFINSARTRFIQESAYLDDRPAAPMRFMAAANLTQLIRREERNVDPGEARHHLKDVIRDAFKGPTLEAVHFPGGPFDIPDDVGDGRPRLAVMSYDAVTVGSAVDTVPELIARCYERKGAEGTAFRSLRNNLAFIVADEAQVTAMRKAVTRHLALQNLKAAERLMQLAEHQRDDVLQRAMASEHQVAVAVQTCYRYLFYPTKLGLPPTDLSHTSVDLAAAAESPGAGQRQVVRALCDLNKLRLAENHPDAPTYIRDRTPLKKGQITTAVLRDEFRRDPALPILAGDDIFKKAIRNGVESGEFVYRRGELLYGRGDPQVSIEIGEDATVFTMGYATERGIWPRPAPKPEHPGFASPGDTGAPPNPPGGFAEPDGGVIVARPPGPSAPPPPLLSAEGVLKEALTIIWEKARQARVGAIASLDVRMYEAGDAFRLLGAVAGVPNAVRLVTLAGGYETKDGSRMEIDFTGTPDDAKPIKDFLEPQLRAASERTVKASFRLSFIGGLPLAGDAPEKLAERLTRFASGAAYVSAIAEAMP